MKQPKEPDHMSIGELALLIVSRGAKALEGQQQVRQQALATRPPIERFAFIVELLQAGKHMSAPALARALEVSAKTIHRDIDFLRDRMELPLQFDRARGGWHLAKEDAL